MTVVVDQPAPDALVRRLESEVAEVAGVLNAAHGRLVELTAELIETDAWRGWGTRSIEHWLVWQAGLSPYHARQVASIARRHDELPEIERRQPRVHGPGLGERSAKAADDGDAGGVLPHGFPRIPLGGEDIT